MDFRKINYDWFASGHLLTVSTLFSMFSNLETIDLFTKTYGVDENAKKLVDVLCVGLKRDVNVRFEHIEHGVSELSRTNNVVVAFSGGKDSTATAMKLVSEGKNVYLFYVKGINKAYPDEENHAKEIAAKLGLPIHIENVRQSGKSSFKESPIKNQVIASMALDYAVSNGYGTSIAFGDFTTDNMSNSQFFESWSDTQEMWDAWLCFVKTYVPNVELIIPFETYNDTLDIISENKEVLELVCGCILPYRFRAMTKAANEKKYNIELLPNRCGSCWKCCVEYIFLVEKGVFELNKDFYLHCIAFLRDKLESVRPEIKEKTMESAYRAFLHRDPLEITKKILENEKFV